MRYSPRSLNIHVPAWSLRLRDVTLFLFLTLDSNETPFNLLSQFPLGLALNPIGRSSINYLRGIQAEGVGTVRPNPGVPLEDDGGLSSDRIHRCFQYHAFSLGFS